MIDNALKHIQNALKSVKSEDTRQKDYLIMLERTCKVNKPIMIDRNVEKWNATEKYHEGIKVWAIDDNHLVNATQITEPNLIGRYRIDNTNSDGIWECWMEIDCNKDLRDKETVKAHWKDIAKAGKKLLDAFSHFGITSDYIMMKPSGRGLHFSVFCKGFRDEKQYTDAMLYIQRVSGLSLNVKQSESKGVVFGFDSAAIGSSRRKIRELGGQNDKLAGFTHYVSLVDNLDMKTYPFVTKAKDVVYPTEIKIFEITKDFINRMHECETAADTKELVQDTGTVVYERDGDIAKLYDCPLIAKIAKDAENHTHIDNPSRIFLSQTFTFFGEPGEQEIHRILSYDPDYSESYTQNQINNVKKNNRKPITCKWAQEKGLCPAECKGISAKSPVMLAWKPPNLDQLTDLIMNHVHLYPEYRNNIHFLLGTAIEREYIPKGNAIWAYLIAPSGSGKTELMMLLNTCPKTFNVDDLSSKALISGFKPEEGKYGMFDKMNDKCVYVKDMSQMLTANKDERNATFGILRNAYDGYLDKMFGNSEEKVHLEAKFGLFIGMTPIIDAYYSLSNQLGERFLKIRFSCDEYATLRSIYRGDGEEYIKERELIQRKINEYISSLTFRKYETPKEFEDLVIELGVFTSYLRTAVFTSTEGDIPVFRGERELPSRLLSQVQKTMYILACIRNKEQVGKEEVDFIGQMLIQTPPLYRIQAFYHLLKNQNVTVGSLATVMGLYHAKAEQILQELVFLKIVTVDDTSANTTYSLKEYFRKCGETYDKLGWYNWLTKAYKDLLELESNPATKEKRQERGLDRDWLKPSD
jgi:hypothetical protein